MLNRFYIILFLLTSIIYSFASEPDSTTWNGTTVAYSSGEIIVGLQNWADETDIASTLTQISGTVIDDFDRLNIGLVQIPSNNDIVSAIDALKNNSAVLYAEPNMVVELAVFNPNDEYYAGTAASPHDYEHQWPLNNSGSTPAGGYNDADIDAPEAWDYETGSSNVKIAVFDTGIPLSGSSLSHPDLDDASRFKIGEDFTEEQNTIKDMNGHGTHVTGIIGAETNNTEGIAGVAHGCKIISFQTIKADNFGRTSSFKDAVYAAVDSNVQIINFSGGWTTYSETVHQAVDYAHNNGVVQVYAAGNEWSGGVRYPARFAFGPFNPGDPDSIDGSLSLLQDWSPYSSVLSVAATSAYDERSWYSSYDPDSIHISVAAPGGSNLSAEEGKVFSTLPDYAVPGYPLDYGYAMGTSMAAPHVTGIAGLVLSRFDTLNASEVCDLIKSSSEDVNGGGVDKYLGHGRVNAFYAVAPPATPANFDGTWYNGHPKITWDENSEPDLKNYIILKSTGGAYTQYATTDNNYYVDYGEFQYSIGHTKTYVYYKIQAADITNQKSNMTGYEKFAVNAPEQSQDKIDKTMDISLAIPDKYELNQNFPNPFNPGTQIKFGLPEPGFTTLRIYNINGQLVKTLVDEHKDAGYHYAYFDGNNLSSGIYFYKLTSGNFTHLKRMLLLK